MARRTKLTPETRESILRFLREGCTRRDAALASGIGESTLQEWLARGAYDRQKGRLTLYSTFLLAVEAAEARARARCVHTIIRAATYDWRAALEYLKRRDREHWGDTKGVVVSGDAERPVRVVVERVERAEPAEQERDG